MKTIRRVLAVAGLLAIVLISGRQPASAGLKSQQTVVIGPDYAYGAMGSARNSGNTVEYISCMRWGDLAGTGNSSCTATDSSGTTRTCTTNSNEAMKSIWAASNSDGYVFFKFNGPACTFVMISNYSFYPPKQ